MVKAFKKASDLSVPYKIVRRLQGDVAVCYENVTRSHQSVGVAYAP